MEHIVDSKEHDHKIDLMIEKLQDMIRELTEFKTSEGRCPYTFAHTHYWCGYPECRDS